MYSVTSSLHRRLKSPKPLGVREGEDANDHSWLVPPARFDSRETPSFFFSGLPPENLKLHLSDES